MIKWLFKYGAVIFIFNTILLSIEQTYSIGNQVFLLLMALFAILLVFNPIQIKNILFHKAFSFLLILNIINILYFLLFHNTSDFEAFKYLIARGIQFSIISVSIFYHFEFYRSKFPDLIINLIFFILIIGFFINPHIFSGRYSGIIWNPNMLSSFVVIAFAFLFLKKDRKTNFQIFMLFVFIIIALASGSRGALVAIILAFFIKYGLSSRNVIYGIIAIISYFIVLNFQIDTSLNRFSDQSLLNDRILQFQYAIASIKNKLFIGYGLDKYAYIDKSLVPYFLKGQIIGAHNGYLAILTQYGIVFGGTVIFIIFQKSYNVLSFFRNSDDSERVYLFIVIYTLIAASYESLMTGINEFHTILFWFSLAILSFSRYKIEDAN